MRTGHALHIKRFSAYILAHAKRGQSPIVLYFVCALTGIMTRCTAYRTLA